MATESYMTNRGLQLLATTDFDATDFRGMLVKSAVANATGKDHNFVSDVTGASAEADCTGYARVTLAGIAVAESDANNNVVITWDDIAWGALGGASNCALAHLVIYKHHASGDGSAEVVAYVGGSSLPFTTNGSTVTSEDISITASSTAA
jgi:hypothetical protein